jgi:hypothetical protein
MDYSPVILVTTGSILQAIACQAADILFAWSRDLMVVVTQLAPGETGTQVCTDRFRDYAEGGATTEKEMVTRLGVELGKAELRMDCL